MADVRLTTPVVDVKRASDDQPRRLQIINPDLVLWDMTRAKHRWPAKVDEAPFLWLTFISWAAARRTHLIPTDMTFEAWSADVLEVEAIDDEADETTGRPTLPVAAQE